MDAEALANNEGYRALVRMRDEAYGRFDQEMKDGWAAVEALEAGNRQDRRRGAAWRRKMDFMRSKWVAAVDGLFKRWVRDFDPTIGTTTSVQMEAAEAFSAMFDSGVK